MQFPRNVRWSALLSLRGRIGRRVFWLLAGPVLVVVMLAAVDTLRSSPSTAETWDIFFFSGFVMALVIGFFGVRRLHDLGRPGWWMLFLILPFPLAFIPIFSNLLLVVPLIMAVFVVMVGFLPGKDDVNAYGPPGSGSPFR